MRAAVLSAGVALALAGVIPLKKFVFATAPHPVARLWRGVAECDAATHPPVVHLLAAVL